MFLQLVITLTSGDGKLAVTVVVRNLFKDTCPTVSRIAMVTGC